MPDGKIYYYPPSIRVELMKIAVVAGLVILLSAATLTSAFAQDLRQPAASRKIATVVEFEMTGCTNSMTCNAELFVGDMVEFTGALMTEDGEPIPNAEVTVYKFIPKPELVPIAEGVTGIDGEFTLSWTAEFTSMEKAPNDVTKKIPTETVTIFAQFEGDDRYGASRSSKNTATLSVNALNIFVNSEKNLYKQGESALVFIAIVDSHDEFVDPDGLRVVLNDREVEVEQKKVGSYTLTIPTLPKEHTQLIVIPRKEGFNIETGFLTIIVDGLK
jgi:hypothetical protein